MDLSSINSIAGTGKSAARTVASALAPRHARYRRRQRRTPAVRRAEAEAAPRNSDITSNDFLTLLVSELKNQDPTQPTDPNQYITQLAQVNSLQQLISINQGIGTLDGCDVSEL